MSDLNIKNDEAHQLATELARLTGETLIQAVTEALRERLVRERRRGSTDDVAAQLMKIGKRYAVLPDTGRHLDEILGYDRTGCRGDPGQESVARVRQRRNPPIDAGNSRCLYNNFDGAICQRLIPASAFLRGPCCPKSPANLSASAGSTPYR